MTGVLFVTATFILAGYGLGTLINNLYDNWKLLRDTFHLISYLFFYTVIGKEYAENVAKKNNWRHKKSASAGTDNA